MKTYNEVKRLISNIYDTLSELALMNAKDFGRVTIQKLRGIATRCNTISESLIESADRRVSFFLSAAEMLTYSVDNDYILAYSTLGAVQNLYYACRDLRDAFNKDMVRSVNNNPPRFIRKEKTRNTTALDAVSFKARFNELVKLVSSTMDDAKNKRHVFAHYVALAYFVQGEIEALYGVDSQEAFNFRADHWPYSLKRLATMRTNGGKLEQAYYYFKHIQSFLNGLKNNISDITYTNTEPEKTNSETINTKKEEVQTMTSTTSTTSTGAQLVAKWGRLKNARKDVVKRFVELKNETIAAFSASTYLSRLQKITSEPIDFDSDARKLASRVYTLLMEILNTTETTTETTETVETKQETTIETKPETTIEPTTDGAPLILSRVVKTLDAVKQGSDFTVLTTLDDSDNVPAQKVVANLISDNAIIGAVVPSLYLSIVKPCGYLVAPSDVVDMKDVVLDLIATTSDKPASALDVVGNVDGNGVDFNYLIAYAVPNSTTTTEEESTMKQNETTNPAPRLSLKKDDEPAPRVELGKKLGAAIKRHNKRQEENAAFIRSIKGSEKKEQVETVNAAPVNAVNVVNVDNNTTAETIDKSAVYIWKDGKRHYAKTPGKRPSDACLAILRNSKGYFDKSAGKWVYNHGLPAPAIDALKRNGARVVESAELVPGFDPAKLDLSERILYEWKRGRVAWLEGGRFNLTYRPASYFDGHAFSARNSELCFNLPTYFLTRSTAKKVAEETGLEITLKENASGFPVRVPRFENDEENEDVETLAGFRWEIAYPQEAFNNLPLKQFNAPDVLSLEAIAEKIGAAFGENLLDALRRRLATAPELAPLYPERRALALDVAACVLLASLGLNPADYAGDISAYRAKFAGAVLAQNGVRVAMNKAKELARRVGKEMGLPIVEDAETAKA